MLAVAESDSLSPTVFAGMQRTDTHIPFLDHIRGLAILMVFAFHCLGQSYPYDQLPWNGWFRDFNVPKSFLALLPVTFGWAGVPVFFVVSGFCIHLSHERSRRKSIPVFFLRRFFRIYPPYLVALLIFCFLPPWHFVSFGSTESLAQFVSHLFLFHNFSEHWFYGINSSFWSVAVEFQLYLIYPLLAMMVKRFGWTRTLWIAGALEIALRTYIGIRILPVGAHAPYWIIGSPFFYWFSWAVGAAAADAFLNHRELPFCKVPVWVFPLLMVATALFKPLAVFSFVFAALSTVSVMDLLLKGRMSWQARVPKFVAEHLRLTGIVSYSIYLLHFPIIVMAPKVVTKLLHNPHPEPLLLLLTCGATWLPIVGLSWIFYRFLELPSIGLGKKVMTDEARQLAVRGASPEA